METQVPGPQGQQVSMKRLTFRGEKGLHCLLLGDSHMVMFHPDTGYEKGPKTPALQGAVAAPWDPAGSGPCPCRPSVCWAPGDGPGGCGGVRSCRPQLSALPLGDDAQDFVPQEFLTTNMHFSV